MNQPMGQTPMQPPQSAAPKWLWITFIVVVLAGGGYFAWYYLMGPGKAAETTTTPATTTTEPTTTTTTPSTATNTSTATTDLIYTNDKYGFTLTFPATWKGYKMKDANLEGTTMTYYINMPTTDKNAIGDTTADAGYYSPFAISVYTLDQWAAVEAAGGPSDTLITKTDKYVFAWSQANGTPPSDWDKGNDIKTIIASFKLQ